MESGAKSETESVTPPPPTHLMVPAELCGEMTAAYVDAIGHKRSQRKRNKLKKELLASFVPLYVSRKVEAVEVEEEGE